MRIICQIGGKKFLGKGLIFGLCIILCLLSMYVHIFEGLM